MTVNPLLGQLGYLESETNASMSACHVNSLDVSVQGSRFDAMSPQSISTPIASRPISVVQTVAPSLPSVTTQPASVIVPRVPVATPPTTVATSPYQVVQSTQGAYTPAILSPANGVRVGTTTVSSLGAAAARGCATDAPYVAVPFGSAGVAVPQLPSAPSVRAAATAGTYRSARTVSSAGGINSVRVFSFTVER